MVDGARTELSVELFSPEAPQVVDGEGPQVKNIVSGEAVSLLNHNHLTTQQSQLDGSA